MRHRIFIAINLTGEIKKELEDYQRKWRDLPIRWTKKENLHITLIFLGSLSSEKVSEVCRIAKEVASRNKSFLVNLNKICYGPPKKMPPRMVWVQGRKSEEFTSLKEGLEKSLFEKIRFSFENREFAPHITLGRIKTWEFRQIEPEERPEVNEEINLSFEVNSIEVMESQLKRTGAEYTVLERALLSD